VAVATRQAIKAECLTVAPCGVRPRSQRRVRDGFSPSSHCPFGLPTIKHQNLSNPYLMSSKKSSYIINQPVKLLTANQVHGLDYSPLGTGFRERSVSVQEDVLGKSVTQLVGDCYIRSDYIKSVTKLSKFQLSNPQCFQNVFCCL
jgi:hypothetical protein